MTRAETVTVFNDMCILAPAALIDAPVAWTTIDDHHVRGTFTGDGQTVSAELTFDANDELVDFVSDDRLAASSNGRTFTRQRWSTPISGYADLASRRLATVGEGRWHPPGGEYTYLEFHLDDIAYNVASIDEGSTAAKRTPTSRHS